MYKRQDLLVAAAKTGKTINIKKGQFLSPQAMQFAADKVVEAGNKNVVSRIVLIPVIAGVSYEFLRFAGRHDSRLVNVLSRPGMWMQGLTTTEPDDSMIEVWRPSPISRDLFYLCHPAVRQLHMQTAA